MVCLRTGGPKMVVLEDVSILGNGLEQPHTYRVAWHGEGQQLYQTGIGGVALRLVESAQPEERLPVYEYIRRMCRGHVDGSLVIQKTLAFTILEMLEEHGL